MRHPDHPLATPGGRLLGFDRRLRSGELFERLKTWMVNDDTWQRILPLAQPRLAKLSDFVPMAAYLFADRLTYDPQLLVDSVESAERAPELLRIAQWEIEKVNTWDAEGIQAVLGRVAEGEGLKMKDLMKLFYIAMAGTAVALPAFDSMAIQGKDMCLRRIQYALEALATIGVELRGKRLKKFTKAYEGKYGRA